MDHLNFIPLNLSSCDTAPEPDQLSDYFTLTAPPSTSIWRAPNANSITTAPMLLTCLRHPFVLAEVTISADFEMEWDQGGLVIFASSPPHELATSSPATRRRRRHSRCYDDDDNETWSGGKWVKAGLEFTGGTLNASSVVATSDSGADWSICPIFPPWSLPQDTFSPSLSSLRIKFERIGDALWIWYRIPHGSPFFPNRESPGAAGAEWQKVREVMGFFSGVEAKGGVWVGCYASRPIQYVPGSSWEDERPEANGLRVEFEELEIL
jgi:regulation of enolase protein 1 (concanavalin A-like superfamily)